MGLQEWGLMGSIVLRWDLLVFSSSLHPHLRPQCSSCIHKAPFPRRHSPLQHPILSGTSIR